eukprot:COSAG05_NODE_353_length_10881_cov_72.725839_8_plen_562_part_00
MPPKKEKRKTVTGSARGLTGAVAGSADATAIAQSDKRPKPPSVASLVQDKKAEEARERANKAKAEQEKLQEIERQKKAREEKKAAKAAKAASKALKQNTVSSSRQEAAKEKAKKKREEAQQAARAENTMQLEDVVDSDIQTQAALDAEDEAEFAKLDALPDEQLLAPTTADRGRPSSPSRDDDDSDRDRSDKGEEMEQGAAIAENATNIELTTRPEQPFEPPQLQTETPETEQPAVTEIGIPQSSDEELDAEEYQRMDQELKTAADIQAAMEQRLRDLGEEGKQLRQTMAAMEASQSNVIAEVRAALASSEIKTVGLSEALQSVQKELDKKTNELTLQKQAMAAKESEVDNLQQLVRDSEGVGFQKGEKIRKSLREDLKRAQNQVDMDQDKIKAMEIDKENLQTLEQDLALPMDTEEAQTKVLAATAKTMKRVVQKLEAMDVDEASPQEIQASEQAIGMDIDVKEAVRTGILAWDDLFTDGKLDAAKVRKTKMRLLKSSYIVNKQSAESVQRSVARQLTEGWIDLPDGAKIWQGPSQPPSGDYAAYESHSLGYGFPNLFGM